MNTPDHDLIWESLVTWISEHTGVARAEVEKVLDAECRYWNERYPLRQAVLDEYRDELDEEADD